MKEPPVPFSCARCEVGWRGSDRCWSCGRRGSRKHVDVLIGERVGAKHATPTPPQWRNITRFL